jgi:hypothetical protein
LARRWTALRLALSAYILFHLAATIAWVIPFSPLKAALMPKFRYYMLPLGLWQSWGMFAPDPLDCTITLESEVTDAKGMRHIHEFTKVADLPLWQKLPRFRHPKLTSNVQTEEYAPQREVVARHAVRSLGLGPESFPVIVSLYYQVTPPAPLGVGQSDPMTPTRMHHLAAYQFDDWSEVYRR